MFRRPRLKRTAYFNLFPHPPRTWRMLYTCNDCKKTYCRVPTSLTLTLGSQSNMVSHFQDISMDSVNNCLGGTESPSVILIPS